MGIGARVTAAMAAMLHSGLQLRLLLGGEFLVERVLRTRSQYREVGAGPRGTLRRILKLGFIEVTGEGQLLQGLAGLPGLTHLGAQLRRLRMQDGEHAVALRLAQVQAAQHGRTRHHQTIAAVSPVLGLMARGHTVPGVIRHLMRPVARHGGLLRKAQ